MRKAWVLTGFAGPCFDVLGFEELQVVEIHSAFCNPNFDGSFVREIHFSVELVGAKTHEETIDYFHNFDHKTSPLESLVAIVLPFFVWTTSFVVRRISLWVCMDLLA